MSSKPEQQNEPTMEEILASIRRIISEDEPQGGKPAAGMPPGTPPAAAKAAGPESPPATGRGADNILDLTKMVAEDGSIVDLAAAPEEEPAAEQAAEPEPETEQGAEAAAEEAAAEEEPAAVADTEEEPSAEELLAPAEEAPAEEAPAEEAPAEQVRDEEGPAEQEPVEEEPVEEELLGEQEPVAEDEAASAAVLAPAPGSDEESEFVSATTARAATASLAAVTKAAMANRQGNAVAIGGGRTLEELVRESLAPELKGWLDENLPDLVERIVREEIRKMIRRAEEQ